jgi:hypothetical protein
MLRFLDPVFLLGLLAVGVPVVLHLLHRRRLPVVLFPLVRLIERAERTRQPRRHLNRVLLLCTRAALLALLALALARTTLGPVAAVVAQGPVAAVVVLDDSLSMAALGDEGRTAFEVGREKAVSLLRSLSEGSSCGLIVASRPDEGEGAGLSHDVEAVASAVAGARVTERHVRMAPALRAAVRVLAQGTLPDRRVILVSDLARHGFEGLDMPPVDGVRPELQVIVPLPPADRPNRSVSGLVPETLPDGRLRVTARVAAWGEAPGTVGVEVRAGTLDSGDPRTVVGRADVQPGSGASTERRFEVPQPVEGWAVVEARIEPDFLGPDDVRRVAHHAARRPRLLVVDGDPQNIALGSETFYLEKALAPGVGLDLDAEVVTLAELRRDDFQGRDVVALCNVPELTLERTEALEAAVTAGAGLVVALGNRVDQRVYNGRLSRLLPATLGVPRESEEEPPGVEAEAGAMPMPRVKVRGHVTLEPDPEARVEWRLEGGDPLVVVGEAGRGRVALLATTLDRDWTDLPINPSYLPFLQALIDLVNPRRQASVLPPVHVGAAIDLRDLADAAGAGATIRKPDGTRAPWPESGAWKDTDLPGVYVVEAGDASGILAAVGVVPNPVESDLARLSRQDLAGLVRGAVDLADAGEGDGSAASSGGAAIWKALLLLLLVATAAESALARVSA